MQNSSSIPVCMALSLDSMTIDMTLLCSIVQTVGSAQATAATG